MESQAAGKSNQEKETRAAVEKTEAEKEKTFRAKMEAAEEEDPGVSDILRDPTMPLTRPMYDAVRESDLAPSCSGISLITGKKQKRYTT